MSTEWTPNFVVNLAAALTYSLLQLGTKRLHRSAFGNPEQQALGKVYEQAFTAMLEAIGPQVTSEMSEHVESLLRSWVNNQEVNNYLLDLALLDSGDPPLTELATSFEAMGFVTATLPVEFSMAISALISGLACGLEREAIRPDSPLFNRVTTLRLIALRSLLEGQHQTLMRAQIALHRMLSKELGQLEARLRQMESHDEIQAIVSSLATPEVGRLGPITNHRVSNDVQRLVQAIWIAMKREKKLTESAAYSKVLEQYISAFRADCSNFPYVTIVESPAEDFSNYYVGQSLKNLQSKHESDKNDIPKSRLLPEELLSLNKHSVVIAGPGVGKSALLNRIGLLVSESYLKGTNGHLIPIKVSATGLAFRTGSLATSLYDQVTEELGKLLPTSLPKDLFSRPFNGVHWLLMIDGLDEVTDQASRTRLIQELTTHAGSASSYRLILTTRPIPEIESLDEKVFAKYVLIPFERREVLDFVHRWFRTRPASTPEDAHLFLSQVEESRVADVCAMPLLLTMAVLVYERDHDLPRHKTTLYERFVRILLLEQESNRATRKFFRSAWEKRYGREGDLVADQLFNNRRALLEHLAGLHNCESGDGAVAYARALGWIPRAIMDSDDDWLRAQFEILLLRTGLITQQGRISGFIHKSLQDYLEASFLYRTHRLQEMDSWATALVTEGSPELLLFLLGLFSRGGDDVTGPVRRLWEKGHLLVAGRALAEGLQIKPELVERIVGDLLNIGKRSDTSPIELLEIVGKVRQSSRAVNGLLSLACSPRTSEEHRVAAAWALGSTGRTEHTTKAWLAIAFRATKDPALRMSAYEAIDSWGYPQRSTKDAWEVLASDQRVSASFRLHAARALTELGNAQPLLSLAKDSCTSVIVRIKATETLEELDLVDEAAQAWSSLVTFEGLGEARMRAIRALGRLGRIHELLAIGFDGKVDPESRTEAGRVLGTLDKADEAATILFTVAGDCSLVTWLRLRAVRALAELGRSDDLLKLAYGKDISTTVRVCAIETLSVLGRSEDLLPLVRDLEVNEIVRDAATIALAKR